MTTYSRMTAGSANYSKSSGSNNSIAIRGSYVRYHVRHKEQGITRTACAALIHRKSAEIQIEPLPKLIPRSESASESQIVYP